MGLVIRQSIFTTIIAYAGVAVGYINLLYLYPKFLEPDQVGLLRTIQDAAILFSPFAQFGVALSIFKFFPQLSKERASESAFISLVLLIGLCGFGIFLIVFRVFESSILSYYDTNAKEIINYTSVILWLTFIVLITAVMEAYSKSLLKTVVPNLLKEVVIRVLMAFLVCFYFLGYLTYDQFIIATVLAWLACLLLLIGYLVRGGNLSLSFNLAALGKGRMREILAYSLFSFAGAAGMILIGKIDSLMVAALAGLTPVAIYTTAFYMASVIEVPKKAITSVAMPLISRAFEKNDMAEVHTLYHKTSINQFIIGAMLLIGIYINLDNVFSLIPRREVYEAGKWVVVIVGIGKLADMAFGPSSEIIVLSKYFAFNIVLIVLLAGVVIIANNLLIPIYGINGAALAAALALIVFNTAKFVFIWAKLGIQPFSLSTVKLMAVALAVLLVNRLIPPAPWIVVDILIRSAIATTAFVSLVYLLRVSPDANDFAARLLQRARSVMK
jgi:O-antigen/teichoic acid export membrane protein